MLTDNCVTCLWGKDRSSKACLEPMQMSPVPGKTEDGGSDWQHREVLARSPLLNSLMQGQYTAFIQSWNYHGRRSQRCGCVDLCVYVCAWRGGIATQRICITFVGHVAIVQLGAVKDTRKEISVESWIWVCDVLPMSGCGSEQWYAKPLSNFIPLIADMISCIAKGDRESLLYRQWLLNWGKCLEPVLIISW